MATDPFVIGALVQADKASAQADVDRWLVVREVDAAAPHTKASLVVVDKSLDILRRIAAAPLRTMQSLVLLAWHSGLLYTWLFTTALVFSSCSTSFTIPLEARWVENRQTNSSQWWASCRYVDVNAIVVP